MVCFAWRVPIYIDSIYVANWMLGPLFKNSGICLWFWHLKHVLQSPNSQNSLWCFSYKSATKIHLINFFCCFGVIIELLSSVACRRYGFSRESKTEKVRNAWLMGEHIWDMEVSLYFASVWHWQAPKRDGTTRLWSLSNPSQQGCTSCFWSLHLPPGVPNLLPLQVGELRQLLIMGLEVKGDWKSWPQGQTCGL